MQNHLAPKGSNSYRFTLKVKSEDIDVLNHVNNVVYLQWINEASERHWAALTNDVIDTKYYWVCIRHEIDYLGEAFLNDEIAVFTWVGESKGVRSIRYVNILKGEKVIAKAKTIWVLINAKTEKPTRIGKDILSLLS